MTLEVGLKTRMPREPSSGIKDAEPHLIKQLLYSGIVKDLDFT